MVGAIYGTHFDIKKPTYDAEDYYSMQCQAVVNCDKKFIDVSVGMLGSTNDSCMKRSSLYHLATTTNMFDVVYSLEGFLLDLLR